MSQRMNAKLGSVLSRLARRSAVIVLLMIGACAAQGPDGPPPEPPGAPASSEGRPEGSAIERHLYPPELVLDHQRALGLDETQRTAILEEIRTSQAELVEYDANLRSERESLVTLLDAATVDEPAALSAAGRVMHWENRVKTVHLRLLIRVRNHLTEEQRAQLEEFR